MQAWAGGEVQLHFDFNLAPRCGANKGEGWDFLGGITFQLRFQLRAAKLGRGGLVFKCTSTSCGAKSRGRGSGWISLCMGEWSDFDFSFGFLGRAHLHFDFDLLLKVWGLRAGRGFGCLLTSTLTSPFLSRCVWETTNQASTSTSVSTWKGVRVKTLDC